MHQLEIDDFIKAKKFYNWEYEDFEISEDVYDTFKENIIENGKKAYEKWNKLLAEYKEKYPKDYKEYISGFERELPENWMEELKNILQILMMV